MSNKIVITKIMKDEKDYTKEELEANRVLLLGFEYNGVMYKFSKPTPEYNDIQKLFSFIEKNGTDKLSPVIVDCYNEYKKAFMAINKDYPGEMFIYKFRNNMVDYERKRIEDYTTSVEKKKEQKNINRNVKQQNLSTTNVKKQEIQQFNVQANKVKIIRIFKNRKSYTDVDWVRGHQLLKGLEYNGKRYYFSKEVVAPNNMASFLQKVKNDVSQNRRISLEIDAYNEFIDVAEKITNEYGKFGGKSLIQKMFDDEIDYIDKEDENVIISQSKKSEDSSEMSGLELSLIGTSLGGFFVSSFMHSAEDPNLFYFPLFSIMSPFIGTASSTAGGGEGLIVYEDSMGNIRIDEAGSSIVVDKDKIEQRAEYIYSKLNKNYITKEKSEIITDSEETANGILNLLKSSSKEELLIKIKALEMVLKEKQEQIYNENQGFQRAL